MREEALDTTHWKKVVAIMQSDFHNGTIDDEITCQTVVLIPKANDGDLQGISLAEVLWKTLTGLHNCRFTWVICFHNVLHGFGAGHRMVNSALKAKILQKLTSMCGGPPRDISGPPEGLLCIGLRQVY